MGLLSCTIIRFVRICEARNNEYSLYGHSYKRKYICLSKNFILPCNILLLCINCINRWVRGVNKGLTKLFLLTRVRIPHCQLMVTSLFYSIFFYIHANLFIYVPIYCILIFVTSYKYPIFMKP